MAAKQKTKQQATTRKRTIKKRQTPKTTANRTISAVEREDTGAPIEHYRGERNDHGTTGDPGDIELETLDANAPYNKTYGR